MSVFPIAQVLADTTTYDFLGVDNSNQGTNNYPIAIEHDSDIFPWTISLEQNDSANPTDAEYINISTDNTSEWITDDSGQKDEMAITFRFFIQEIISDISNIQIRWNGNTGGTTASNHSIWLRKDGLDEFGGTNTWVQLGSSLSIDPNVDTDLIRNLISDFSTYINGSSGQFEFVVTTDGNSESLKTNYIEVITTYITTPLPDTTPPSTISDLSTSGATTSTIDLDWTAVGDDANSGTATTYDIRYSTSNITNDTDFNNATQVSGEPSPSIAGTPESMTITGLSSNTLYYFAIKTSDEVPNTSTLSNVSSLSTTIIPDTIAPSVISDLALSNPSDSAITVSWTAPGDDGSTGTATIYDLRYSTSNITNDTDFNNATQVSGEPTPSIVGSSENKIVAGLDSNTLYYFAIKTSDEVPNTSTLSNVFSLSTTATPDITAPATISDLITSGITNNSINLDWTAQGDDGSTGTASTYDIRYSTSNITNLNWSSAIQATGEPSPSVAGSSESFTISSLSPSTLYYFAIKTSDEVPNESALSNVPTGTTSAIADTTPPSTISDLSTSGATTSTIDLDWTAVGDDANSGTATTYDIRYSTSNITNDTDFNNATQVSGEPSPSIAGSNESMTVTGLSDSTLYYFAIKTSDEVPNTSALSNIPSLSTITSIDNIAPSSVSDLTTSTPTQTSIDLDWTAPGDDGSTGIATTYDIRYSTSNITNDTDFDNATQVANEPIPSTAGSFESITISGLSSNTTYYFAIKTSDEVPNESTLSNITSLSTNEEPNIVIPIGGVSGGISATSIVFSGQAYPGSKIIVQMKDDLSSLYKNVPLSVYQMSNTGEFYISYTALLSGQYFLTLKARDKKGQETGIQSFNVDFRTDKRLLVENIIIPPTISFNYDLLKLSDALEISGYSSPDSKVELKIDDIIKKETTADSSGYYSFLFNPGDFILGLHRVKVKQSKGENESNFSFPRTFKVSSLIYPQADFNKDDEVNVNDWSIFLFRWGGSDTNLRSKLDLDSNGSVDIRDFSIFLKAIKTRI